VVSAQAEGGERSGRGLRSSGTATHLCKEPERGGLQKRVVRDAPNAIARDLRAERLARQPVLHRYGFRLL
jgi:hypothetical protein